MKWIFQDLSDSRVTGRDAKDSDDELQTAAEYLWATLKTHKVMAEYLSSNFDDHPALASVRTKFVTYNNFESNIGELEARLSKAQKDLNAQNSSIGKLANRVHTLENP